MQNLFLIPFAKLILFFSRSFGLGAGSTWPGHVVLEINPHFLRDFRKSFKGKIILIAGTNGKTTTSKMIRVILESNGKKIIHNEAGANLLNGIASAIVNKPDGSDVALFEVDENTLPNAVKELLPDIIVLLNLFRDQLDRYGEVDSIANKWKKAFSQFKKNYVLILNSDDPHIAFLGENVKAKLLYFGIDDENLFIKAPQHAMDATNCPRCSYKLDFSGIYFSHLGLWSCKSCKLKRPTPDISKVKSPLPGVYNIYNTQAAILVAKTLGIEEEKAKKLLTNFSAAFGRQEEFEIAGKKIQILLSKNPAGFNESIRTVKGLGAKTVLLVLNDRIPDGRDVSWIWDVDFEELSNVNLIISGDRAYDMGLRIKYANSSKNQIIKNLKEAIEIGLKQIGKGETLYILPTYSAMLEVRKILTGRKIL